MKNTFGNKTWKPKKTKNAFNPNREFVKNAVKEFLDYGGVIKRPKPEEVVFDEQEIDEIKVGIPFYAAEE